MKRYFGNRQFNSLLIRSAIPIMIYGLVNIGVNLIDSLMVGQLGDAVVGGVTATNRFFSLVQAGIMSITGTAGIYLSQFYGASNEEKMKESFKISIWSSYFILIPFFFIAFFFSETVISFFTKNAAIVQNGMNYMKIVCFGYLPFCLSTSISTAFRSIGKQKLQLYISFVSVFVKITLNYLLMFGNMGFPVLGVVGAAISTVCTRTIEAILYLIVLKTYDFPFRVRLMELSNVSFPLLFAILKRAIPLCANDLLWAGSNSVLLKIMGMRGAVSYNGYAIASALGDIFHSLNSSYGQATILHVSRKLGSRDLQQAKEDAYKTIGLAMQLGVVCCVLMYSSSYFIPMIYSASTQEVIQSAMKILQIQAFCFFLFEMNMQHYFILKSGGDSFSALLMDSATVWLYQIPLLTLIANFTNLTIFQMYLVGQSNEVLKIVLSTYLVHKEKWVKNLTKG